jgi:uncharacterized surface protein with fasciclin (FAS1) repeats
MSALSLRLGFVSEIKRTSIIYAVAIGLSITVAYFQAIGGIVIVTFKGEPFPPLIHSNALSNPSNPVPLPGPDSSPQKFEPISDINAVAQNRTPNTFERVQFEVLVRDLASRDSMSVTRDLETRLTAKSPSAGPSKRPLYGTSDTGMKITIFENTATLRYSNGKTEQINLADFEERRAVDRFVDAGKEEKTIMIGGAAMFPSKNIIQNAVNSKDHTTLVAAVRAAGLVETLEGKGPFTVFAPTNAAFGKMPTRTVDTLVKPENKTTLTKILTYHVVSGKIETSSLTDGKKLKTVEGEELTVRRSGDRIMLVDVHGGSSNITIPNINQKNGVIHVIDAVLNPS